MGFYPTPPKMTEKIMNRLRFTGPARVYDPCCGEGTALGTVAEMAPAGSVSYGIELDGARELEARKILSNTVRCGYEFARVEPASMNLIWLNPPYDGADGSGGNVFRKELQFLRDVSKHVAPGGVLVFIILRTSLYRDMVDALANRYTELSVYDDENATYKQVVVFGTRRAKSPGSWRELSESDREARNSLLAYGKNPDIPMPYLDEPDGKQWTVPGCEDISQPILFRGYILDEQELLKDLESSESFAVATNILESATVLTTLKRPLLPFRRTHMATLIAAGALNGAIGSGETRHMVVGMTRKKIDTEIVTDDKGRETIINTESYITAVRTIEADGTIKELS